MKNIILFLAFLVNGGMLFPQVPDFEVPEFISGETLADYAWQEQSIVDCTNWLMNTPLMEHLHAESLFEQEEKRKRANAFLMGWLMMCPYLTTELRVEFLDYKNPEFTLIFLGGWAKYSIESKNFRDEIMGHLAGIEAVIEYYIKNRQNLKKDKVVEKFIKMRRMNTLEDFIAETLRKDIN